jgi:hypothetical protein
MAMKGTMFLFVVASMLLLSAVANAQTTNRPARTNAILNGSYGVLHDGVDFGEAGHLAEVAVVEFDGEGHWTLDATIVRQGSGLDRHKRSNATYTVNPDCTGSAELHGSASFTFDFVVLDGGQELRQIATRAGQVVTWEVRKQNLATCTKATLTGSYGVLQTGFDVPGNPIGGVGLITFDGKGTWSLTLTEARKDVPIQRINNPNGSYTVNADCRGSASLEKLRSGQRNGNSSSSATGTGSYRSPRPHPGNGPMGTQEAVLK